MDVKKIIMDNIVLAVNILGSGLGSLLGLGVALIFNVPAYQMIICVFAGTLAWGFTYVVWGFLIMGEVDFGVRERFKQYHTVAKAGFHLMCLPPLVDRIAPNDGRGTYRYERLDLYVDEPGNEIDFTDDSATVKAQIWFMVTDEFKWTYGVKNSRERIEEIFDGVVRPLLQAHSIDSAQVNLTSIAETIKKDQSIKDSLEKIGVELEPTKGFIITDIVLSAKTKEERARKLAGKKTAEEAAARGSGYSESILSVIRSVDAENERRQALKVPLPPLPVPTFDEAKKIYEEQRVLETLSSTGANITFVSPDMKGVNVMLGLDKK